MDNKKELHASPRNDFGSAASRRIRRNGQIPSVVYGNKQPLHICVDSREFLHNFHGQVSENTIIKLTVENRQIDVLIKDFQSDILTNQIFHIDFLEIVEGHLLRTHIPVILDGVPIGVREEGGLLEHLTETIEVECLPKDLPEAFRVDVTDMRINDSISLEKITIDPKIRVLSSPQQILAHISVPKAVASQTASAENAQ